MTTTVNKHGLRKAAGERRTKHAQRTPLPPRPGVVEEAREVVKEAKRIKPPKGTAECPVCGEFPKLRPSGKLSPHPDAGERCPGSGRDPAVIRAEAAARPRVPEATCEGSVGRPAEKARTARRGSTTSEVKAFAFADALGDYGWTAEASTDGAVTEVIGRRGEEAIHILWDGGVFQYESATYTYADWTTRLRNASAGRQYASRTAEVAAGAFAARGTAPRPFVKKAERKSELAEEPARAQLPFDPSTATDVEVVDGLLGKKVEWHNRQTGSTETALMPIESRRVEVVLTDAGDRIVKFCCRANGYRAFRLSALVRVGGGVTLRRAAKVA